MDIKVRVLGSERNATVPAKSSCGTKSRGASSETSFTSATKHPIITAERRHRSVRIKYKEERKITKYEDGE
jgi:hypothetical protein